MVGHGGACMLHLCAALLSQRVHSSCVAVDFVLVCLVNRAGIGKRTSRAASPRSPVQALGDELRRKFAETKTVVLTICRQTVLLHGCLNSSPELDEKIKLRGPYVVPLNVLQVGCLTRAGLGCDWPLVGWGHGVGTWGGTGGCLNSARVFAGLQLRAERDWGGPGCCTSMHATPHALPHNHPPHPPPALHLAQVMALKSLREFDPSDPEGPYGKYAPSTEEILDLLKRDVNGPEEKHPYQVWGRIRGGLIRLGRVPAVWLAHAHMLWPPFKVASLRQLAGTTHSNTLAHFD